MNEISVSYGDPRFGFIVPADAKALENALSFQDFANGIRQAPIGGPGVDAHITLTGGLPGVVGVLLSSHSRNEPGEGIVLKWLDEEPWLTRSLQALGGNWAVNGIGGIAQITSNGSAAIYVILT